MSADTAKVHGRTRPTAATWKPLGGIVQVRQALHGPVWSLNKGVTVYPARDNNGSYWRAQWYDPDGTRRATRAVDEATLASKLLPVLLRLDLDSDNTGCTGSELISWYLSPDRLPIDHAWSRSHRATQERLCRLYVLPAIADKTCEDIRLSDLQDAVNLANTPGQGQRAAKCIHAVMSAGLAAGYLTNPRLASTLHWQALGRAYQRPTAIKTRSVAGPQVGPAEIPGHREIAELAAALTEVARAPWWRELMPYVAAYAGLRLGELLALPATVVDCTHRQILVDVKAVEVGGKVFIEEPKGRRHRTTVYPQHTPLGRPLAELLEQRIDEALQEQARGVNRNALMLPAPRGGYLNSSNFTTRIAGPAYRLSDWRDANGIGSWTWHSLRHTFCSTALDTWDLPVADVSILAGHSNTRITMELYVGALSGVLQRAFDATASQS